MGCMGNLDVEGFLVYLLNLGEGCLGVVLRVILLYLIYELKRMVVWLGCYIVVIDLVKLSK